MSLQFNISVIIPVYNAAKYVRKSVKSALVFDEVGEIILIENNSTNNAIEVCLELEKKYDKVKLFRYPNFESRGAAASRNFGIVKSKFEYLDADDYFLPKRFQDASKILSDNSEIDGVY
jgi:glycosyltransferase involved in cell wall biosynthesis